MSTVSFRLTEMNITFCNFQLKLISKIGKMAKLEKLNMIDVVNLNNKYFFLEYSDSSDTTRNSAYILRGKFNL